MTIHAFETSFSPPLAPVVTLTPDADTARIRITIDNPEVDVTTEGDQMVLAGGATSSGTDAILDGQNEEASVSQAGLAAGRQRFRATLQDSAQVADDCVMEVKDSGGAVVATRTVTLTGALTNYDLDWDAVAGETYTCHVRKATATANTITVDKVRVRPAVLTTSNKIQRREQGGSTWDTLTTGLAVDGTHDDYSPGSGVTYEYRAVATGENGVSANGTAASATVDFDQWRARSTSDTTLEVQFAYSPGASWRLEEARSEVQVRSRYPVTFKGGASFERVPIRATFINTGGLTPREWRERLRDLVQGNRTVYLRSPYGDVWKGELHDPRGVFNDPFGLEELDIEFRETGAAP